MSSTCTCSLPHPSAFSTICLFILQLPLLVFVSPSQVREWQKERFLPCVFCEKKSLDLWKDQKSRPLLKWLDPLFSFWGLIEPQQLLYKTIIGLLTGFTLPILSEVSSTLVDAVYDNHSIGLHLYYVAMAYRYTRPFTIAIHPDWMDGLASGQLETFIVLDQSLLSGEESLTTYLDQNTSDAVKATNTTSSHA